MRTLSETMMQTYTGRVIDLSDFSEEDVRMPDIAHALAILNRFTGHSKYPYSVAQHSVMVSKIVPQEHAVWGLLHDASEAYLGDVATPLKRMLPEYRDLEEHIQRTIARKYGLCWPMPQAVKDADLRALMAEKRELLTVDHDWGIDAEPIAGSILPYCWQQSKQLFEGRFKELWCD